jgi:hypothetical protein
MGFRVPDGFFDEYKLSDKEIQQAIAGGILLVGAVEKFVVTPEGSSLTLKESFRFLNEIGVKESYRCHDDIHWGRYRNDFFRVTDFYLIHFLGVSHAEPEQYEVIPLEKVEYIRIEYADNSNGRTKPIKSQVSKNPVKGAVVGGVVAGVPGAVVGAALNSGTKTTYSLGSCWNKDDYNLEIKMLGCDKVLHFLHFFEDDVLKSSHEEIAQKHNLTNEVVRDMIENAKKERSIEEKRQIVHGTSSEGRKARFFDNLGCLAFFLLIVVFVVYLRWMFGMMFSDL